MWFRYRVISGVAQRCSLGHNWEPLSRHLFSLCENHQVLLQEGLLDFTAFPRIRVVLIFSRMPRQIHARIFPPRTI